MGKTVVMFIAALALSGVPQVQAQHQHPPADKKDSGAAAQPPSGRMQQGGMAEQCKAMMSKRQQMMANMKAMDARLADKVKAMNSAQGDAKIDAVAAVVEELVTQRRQMHEQMTSMNQGMMAHMGEHMTHGGSGEMAQCPMMKNSGR